MAIDDRIHLVTSHSVIVLPYNISIIMLKLVNHTFGINLQPNTLFEIEENPILSIEQPNITVVPVLHKVGHRILDSFLAVLGNQGGHNISFKRISTIGYVKGSDYIENSQSDQQDNVEVTRRSHEKLSPLPEISPFMFHHNFYPQP